MTLIKKLVQYLCFQIWLYCRTDLSCTNQRKKMILRFNDFKRHKKSKESYYVSQVVVRNQLIWALFTENSLWSSIQNEVICKLINRKVKVKKLKTSLLKDNHCQFIFIYSLSKRQKLNDIKHHLKSFDCVKNQFTKYKANQEQIDFSKVVNLYYLSH